MMVCRVAVWDVMGCYGIYCHLAFWYDTVISYYVFLKTCKNPSQAQQCIVLALAH